MNTTYGHSHDFAVLHEHGQRRSLQVLVLTLVVMVVEIVAGTLTGSMALLADGWHMSTHAAAFMIVLAAYHYARKHRNDPAFSFGTGKFSVLGGFASAVALAMVALLMVIESMHRMIQPEQIHFNEALGVALLGLLVNVASALILKTPHEHHHHGHDHHHHHHDHNLKAAYLHVLADALTSLLAIVALVLGKYFGWIRLDAAIGMVGGAVIMRWAFGLLKETAPILLDKSSDDALVQKIVEIIGSECIVDLHVWRVSPKKYSVILGLVVDHAEPPCFYKQQLTGLTQIAHLTVEVNSN